MEVIASEHAATSCVKFMQSMRKKAEMLMAAGDLQQNEVVRTDPKDIDKLMPKAIELYKTEKNVSKIARQLGLKNHVLHTRLKKLGLKETKKGNYKGGGRRGFKNGDDELRAAQKAMKLRSEGLPWADVGAALKVHPTTLQFICKRHGLHKPKTKEESDQEFEKRKKLYYKIQDLRKGGKTIKEACATVGVTYSAYQCIDLRVRGKV